MNYTVPNTTKLPEDVASALVDLEAAWLAGDLTHRGYMRRKNELLEPFSQLLVANGNMKFPGGRKSGGGRTEGERGGKEGERGGKEGQRGGKEGERGGGGRKLLGVSEAGVAKERSPEDVLQRLGTLIGCFDCFGFSAFCLYQ